jgi:aspartyl-tRNA(Asn)/glutamyl-tRNA(Gln) amidotransferase subunit A
MNSNDDLTQKRATELVGLYARRELSPVEVTSAVLERIVRHEPQVNAFACLDAEAALAAAARSEQRILAGAPLGELEGIPVSVKDLIDVRGFPTRKGSRTSSSQRTEHDAPVAARLREQGAILLGKITTSEFGLKGLGESPLTGITRNPWKLSRSTGGSSAGAVGAVAAGFGPIAIGTDGGGSIRVPSAYTGVVGLKPSFGRVATCPPLLAGVPPLVGPITRSVADVILVLRAIARPDARDVWSLGHVPFQRERGSLHGVRVAFSTDLGFAKVAPDVQRAFEAAVARLRDLSGIVLEQAHPELGPQTDTLRTLFEARAAETLRSIEPARRDWVDPDVRAAAEAGERLRAADVLAAEAQRSALIAKLSAFHARYDLLLTPTTAFTAPAAAPAPKAGAAQPERSPFAAAFSLSRQPAISVPCGLGDDGLPIGLQVVGRHFEEDLVLTAAWAVESTTPFPFRPQFAPE